MILQNFWLFQEKSVRVECHNGCMIVQISGYSRTDATHSIKNGGDSTKSLVIPGTTPAG